MVAAFCYGRGGASRASIYGTGLVEDVRMKRDGGVGEAEVIYEGGAKEGVMEQEMEDVQYSYWIEVQCSDGSYKQTPIITPDSGRNTAEVNIEIEQYKLLLKALGVEESDIPDEYINRNKSKDVNAERVALNSDRDIVFSREDCFDIVSLFKLGDSDNINNINIEYSMSSVESLEVAEGEFVRYYIWDHLGSSDSR